MALLPLCIQHCSLNTFFIIGPRPRSVNEFYLYLTFLKHFSMVQTKRLVCRPPPPGNFPHEAETGAGPELPPVPRLRLSPGSSVGGYVFRNDDGHIASVVTLSSPSYAGRRPLPSPAARESAQACAASSACLTSAMRSSAFSMPQERRTRSGDTPQAASSASVI